MRTPGPWLLTKFAGNGGMVGTGDGPLLSVTTFDSSKAIANVRCGTYQVTEEQEANAKAIAAVPDLIEALKAFLVKPSIGMDRELILAKAALTKAGETL